jgi:F-type H+-transporting ATPase subunit gamma
MATLKEISTRLKSVQNIGKITASMKMVSAAKFSRAERQLKVARVVGVALKQFAEKAQVAMPEKVENELAILISSDRGLCGAIHSSLARNIRARLVAADTGLKVICVGDKIKAMLSRKEGKRILYNFNEIGKRPPTFGDASSIADAALQSGYNFGTGSVLYNHFKSAIAYETTSLPLYSFEQLAESPELVKYELEDDIIQNFQEFHLAVSVYYAMMEGAASELSARMSAMENASNNAGDMISSLTLLFNRTRQAVITRELIEIISGASALE